MSTPRSLLVVVTFISMALAGCVSGGDPAIPQAAEPAGPAAFDETTGGVEGDVLDDEAFPVVGATAGLRELEGQFETVTDDNGRFSMSHVPPGTYTLDALRLGYESIAQRIEVKAGQVTHVQLFMTPIPVKEPWIQHLDHVGFMPYGFGLGRTALCVSCGNNDTTYFMFGGFPEDFEGMVVEAIWDTDDFLGFDLNQRGDPAFMWYRTRGESPVHYFVERCADYTGEPYFGRQAMPCTEEELEVTREDCSGSSCGHLETWYVGRFQDETHNADSVCQEPTPGGTLPGYEQGCYGIGAATELRWNTWVSIFHLEMPASPETYSAFPDA